MDADRPTGRTEPMQREIDAFHAALERPADERAAFVETQYAGDPKLVRRLLRLLDAHERAERTDAADSKLTGARAAAAVDPLPERIGPYRIFAVLGEGGMGVVYAAEQREPFHRRVAIKVIKLGMDTREVVARFEAERQAMAIMDHPGVAKALDAGVTPEGRPYFVMELVEGVSLTAYCARHRLALRDRLRLFADVCVAIRHAHQKGVIHRDLKPSNILVAEQEGRPVPKVIDFGIAKATAAPLTERTLFTEQGRPIGTPEYMSPEQADLSGLDVDTRTDVYALGVILYELLTGVLPFDPKALRSGGYAEVLRIVREVDPPRPSTRLAGLARDAEHAPKGARELARTIRGDLDWIVMRAIEKDRARRYPTANALAEEVERYLDHRPVLAGPPSFAYTARKFVRRHRIATALIALALFSTALGVTGLTVGLLRARAAEALAVRRADNAQAAADFLEHVLFQADPEFGGGGLTLLEVMERAGRLVDEDLGPYPEVEASVRESLGVAYRRRSMYAEAEPHLVRSLALRRDLHGDHHLEAARSYIALANLASEHEGDIEGALDLLRRAHDAYERYGVTDTQADAWLQLDLGIANLMGDRLAAAERAFGRCRAILARERGPDHPDVSRPLRGLASVALARDEPERAERLAREAVALCEVEGAAYIGARAELVLARVLLESGRLDEAEERLAHAGERFTDTVGPRHLRFAERDVLLAELLLRRGHFADADRVAARCEDLQRRTLHPDHPALLQARLLRARARIGLGELDGIEAELRAIGAAAERRFGPDHPLAIRVAKTRVDRAHALGDTVAVETHEQRVADLERRRAARHRSEDDG